MILTLEIFAGAFLFMSVFLILFCAYATLHRMQKEGTLTLFYKVFGLLGIVVGYLMDLAFNFTFGALMFLEAPWKTLTFTFRCKLHINDPDWRGRLARWWQVKLNHIEAGHV